MFTATADGIDDDGESVKLTFGTLPAGVSAGTIASTTIAIIDNDEEAGQVTLSLSPSTIAENGGSSTVTASLSSTSTAATTVTVSVDPASAVSLSSNTVLTMAAGGHDQHRNRYAHGCRRYYLRGGPPGDGERVCVERSGSH